MHLRCQHPGCYPDPAHFIRFAGSQRYGWQRYDQCFEEQITQTALTAGRTFQAQRQHPADRQEDLYAAHEAMEQLIELGYVEDRMRNAEKAIQKTVAENNYYLARALHTRTKN